jgi:hypothetical protein
MFDQDPDAVDLLLYKALIGNPETVVETEDVVGSIEADERAIEYDDPIDTRGIFLPFDFGGIMAMDSGAQPGDFEVPVVMLIKETDIPKGSVVQYDEYVSDTEVQTFSMYILKSEAVGQAPSITMKHYMIPFFDDEGALTHE